MIINRKHAVRDAGARTINATVRNAAALLSVAPIKTATATEMLSNQIAVNKVRFRNISNRNFCAAPYGVRAGDHRITMVTPCRQKMRLKTSNQF